MNFLLKQPTTIVTVRKPKIRTKFHDINQTAALILSLFRATSAIPSPLPIASQSRRRRRRRRPSSVEFNIRTRPSLSLSLETANADGKMRAREPASGNHLLRVLRLVYCCLETSDEEKEGKR